MEYYAAMKRSEAPTQATGWMDPEHTLLGERSRHSRTHSGVTAWVGNVQNRQIHRDRKWISGGGGATREDGVSFGG